MESTGHILLRKEPILTFNCILRGHQAGLRTEQLASGFQFEQDFILGMIEGAEAFDHDLMQAVSELYDDGKSIDQIADLKELTVRVVENMLKEKGLI